MSNHISYLIWLDILGFEELPKEIQKNNKISSNRVREEFINLINNKINEMKKNSSFKNYSKEDEWILITDSISLVYELISQIINIETSYLDYKYIPFEIAICLLDNDINNYSSDREIIIHDEIISVLKSNIIGKYKKYYRKINNTSIKQTYIVVDRKFYLEIDGLNKKYYNEINFENDIFYNINVDIINKKGKLTTFLKLIDKNNKIYEDIDLTYVTPNEYSKIVEILEENNVIFLIGDPAIGKTFTAIYLLWTYYLKGYIPIFYSGQETEDRKLNRKLLIDFFDFNKKSIIYFEDPFGRTVFESRDELRYEIGNFVNNIKKSNSKAIITSRTNLFIEFNEKKLTESELKTEEMSLVNTTYSIKKMEEILLNWAQKNDCIWLSNIGSTIEITKEVISKLKTPLSIRDFTIESKNIIDYKDILKIINTKTKETKKIFADEIINMEKHIFIYFNCFYILSVLDIELIKGIYYKLLKMYDIDADKILFENIYNNYSWKINKSKMEYDEKLSVWRYYSDGFTHPSYEDGLIESWSKPELEKIIVNIFTILTTFDIPDVRELSGMCLIKNYNQIKFQNEAHDIIIKLTKDKKSVIKESIFDQIARSEQNLPTNFILELYEIGIKDKNGQNRSKAMEILGNRQDGISQNKLLDAIEIGLHDRAAGVRLETIRTMIKNFDKLPPDKMIEGWKISLELTYRQGYLLKYYSNSANQRYFQKITSKGIVISKKELPFYLYKLRVIDE